MRSIKFRGRRVDNGIMVYGYYFWNDCDNQPYIMVDYHEQHEIFLESAEQYTGLNDKNGKNIYEGDIVIASWYSHKEPLDDTTGEVIFNQGWMSYCIWDEDNKTMSEMNGQGTYTWEIEVIGNIYENKDLSISSILLSSKDVQAYNITDKYKKRFNRYKS